MKIWIKRRHSDRPWGEYMVWKVISPRHWSACICQTYKEAREKAKEYGR